MAPASAKILIVDDDRLFREAYSDLLRAQGHEVITASSADEALGRFEPGGFDVALVDLVLPKRDGLELTSALRKRDPDQEVVIVTQRDDVQTAIRALRAGASDYLLKPVDEAELTRCIDRTVDRARLRRERARLLDENLEFVRHQVLYRRCMELLSTLDLERLQESALGYLCQVCDAQSGAIWIADEKGALRLRAYRGLIDRAALFARIDPAEGPLAAGLATKLPFEPPGAAPGSAFYLPLWTAGELVGLVLCADKLTGGFHGQDQSVARAV
ncbi:MAG: response regulator, partial [Myxococcales bacterium]